MKYLLALDQGTTSSRTIVFDETGRPVASAQREFRQHFPQPGWVEHDPEEIWQKQSATVVDALAKAGLQARDIAALGITNQRETVVVWDRRTGQPIAPAIVWQDRRTAGFCAELRAAGHEALIAEKTGLVIDAYFSASKLRWLLDNVPDARARATRGELAFGTIDSWLVWKLTGGRLHITDASNASRTMLVNLATGDWDADLLALFDIPRALLPEIRDSSEVYAAATEVVPGVRIAGIAGDQQAALFGQACLAPGMAKNTYGTGCFMLLQTGATPVRSRQRLLTTIAWRLGGRLEYALEGSVFVAGAAVQYLRDGLGLIRSAAEIEPLATSVPDTGGVYFVPAFVGLGAPYWDPHARGALLGLTRGTRPAHIARAAVEAIAHQVTDVLRAMQADTDLNLAELRVDGGAAVNDLLMQFQADLLGCPVVRPRCVETTALGAASLAGLAVGLYATPQEIAARWQQERRFTPSMAPATRDAHRRGWHRAVERARAWAES
ncbi:MAG: glycerol kinase GlpK [Opitutae bacterium]|nr:glycerol kinase GlpK [Opitutae bacterium]